VIPDTAETLDAWRAGRLDELVLQVLETLVGEPLLELGRAADMMWMGFGDVVLAPTRVDPDRRLARHRLHVSCPLRLDSAAAVLVASSDIYRRPCEPHSSARFADWDKPGANLFDALVATYWRANEPGSVRVDRISADSFGGLELRLSGDQVIRIFPSRSGADEHWRYFQINSDHDHFVVLPGTDEPIADHAPLSS
jgi:hypothetical protein